MSHRRTVRLAGTTLLGAIVAAWERCCRKSSRAGMTGRNPGGHGFSIAHRHWRVF